MSAGGFCPECGTPALAHPRQHPASCVRGLYLLEQMRQAQAMAAQREAQAKYDAAMARAKEKRRPRRRA